MSTTRSAIKALGVGILGLVLVAGAALTFSPTAKADAIVFLTRLNQVIATYPNSNAFSVGTTTPAGGAAKLSATLNATETFKKAFEVASTTGTGTATTTADLFLVKNSGCIQVTSTSSATQISLFFSTAGATSTFNGTAFWKYGACP